MAYLLPEGQIDWIEGMATLSDDNLAFTWTFTDKNRKQRIQSQVHNSNNPIKNLPCHSIEMYAKHLNTILMF